MDYPTDPNTGMAMTNADPLDMMVNQKINQRMQQNQQQPQSLVATNPDPTVISKLYKSYLDQNNGDPNVQDFVKKQRMNMDAKGNQTVPDSDLWNQVMNAAPKHWQPAFANFSSFADAKGYTPTQRLNAIAYNNPDYKEPQTYEPQGVFAKLRNMGFGGIASGLLQSAGQTASDIFHEGAGIVTNLGDAALSSAKEAPLALKASYQGMTGSPNAGQSMQDLKNNTMSMVNHIPDYAGLALMNPELGAAEQGLIAGGAQLAKSTTNQVVGNTPTTMGQTLSDVGNAALAGGTTYAGAKLFGPKGEAAQSAEQNSQIARDEGLKDFAINPNEKQAIQEAGASSRLETKTGVLGGEKVTGMKLSPQEQGIYDTLKTVPEAHPSAPAATLEGINNAIQSDAQASKKILSDVSITRDSQTGDLGERLAEAKDDLIKKGVLDKTKAGTTAWNKELRVFKNMVTDATEALAKEKLGIPAEQALPDGVTPQEVLGTLKDSVPAEAYHRARIAYDAQAKEMIPSVFQDSAQTKTKILKQAVRNVFGDFLKELPGVGEDYSNLMERQSNLFRAKDNVIEHLPKEISPSVLNRIISNPLVKKGLGGAATALGAGAVYEGYKGLTSTNQ